MSRGRRPFQRLEKSPNGVSNEQLTLPAGQNNSDQIGRAGFNRLMAILAGAEAPKQTVLPSPIITKDNAVRFYNPESVF